MESALTYKLASDRQINLSRWMSDISSSFDNDFMKLGTWDILGPFANKGLVFKKIINDVKSSFFGLPKDYVKNFEKNVSVTRLMLEKSFEESYKNISDDFSYVTVFEKMADVIQSLNFKDCFVDASQKRRRIDFNLAFDNDIFVSIAQNVDFGNSDEVMFAISQKKENIVIDQMCLRDLIKKIKEMPEITNKVETV